MYTTTNYVVHTTTETDTHSINEPDDINVNDVSTTTIDVIQTTSGTETDTTIISDTRSKDVYTTNIVKYDVDTTHKTSVGETNMASICSRTIWENIQGCMFTVKN